MKKFLTIMAALLVALGMQAYDYPYLSFQTSEGTVQSVSVNELIITFSNGQLVLTNTDGDQTISLSDLSYMFFSKEANTAGVTRIGDATNQTVEVFTVNGLALGRFESIQKAKAELKPGLYLMKSNGKTQKVVIR
jgi:hypothetical protein